MKRMWLPGWQMKNTCFDALKASLNASSELTLSYENEQGSLEAWLEKASQQITEPTQLIGWSLGGTLAYQLANRNRFVQQCLLINTNSQFSGENGLEPGVAKAFLARYQANPNSTRKRFAALVDRSRKSLVEPFLCSGDQQNTLAWLYGFNAAKFNVSVPCHILLCRADQLVPYEKAAKSWQALSAASITTLEGQHSAPMFALADLVEWIKLHE